MIGNTFGTLEVKIRLVQMRRETSRGTTWCIFNPTSKEVNDRNIECLQRNVNLILRIDALHNVAVKCATSQKSKHLVLKAYLYSDAFVLLAQKYGRAL